MKNLLFTLALTTALISKAQDRFESVKVITTKATDQVYMLGGSEGNVLIQISEDKVVMIDSHYASLSKKIKKALSDLTDHPITFIINTHHHGNHTGGNENFNTEKTTVIAHENVLKRLQKSGKSEGFLPEKTLKERYELSLPDETNHIIHVHNAHTDGDSFVYLTKSNVVHMGGVFFNGRYPHIDLKSGGSITGYIAAQKQIMTTINEETKIIPGHGPLASYKELSDYIAVLMDLKTQIKKRINNGKSREEIETDSSITSKYDDAGYGDGYINSSKIRTTIYDSLLLASNNK